MATTWASTLDVPCTERAVKATCTTGTEAAPTLATEGIALGDMRGVTINIISTGAGYAAPATPGAAFTAGTLDVYGYDDLVPAWFPINDLQLAVAAQTSQGFAEIAVAAGFSRLAAVPNGLTQASIVRMRAAKVLR